MLCHSLRIALNVNEFIEVAAQKVTSDGEVCRKERIWKEYAGPFNQLLVIINSSLDFFIYVFFDKAFQQVLRTHLHMKNPFQCTCGNGDNKRCDTNGKSTIKSDVELKNVKIPEQESGEGVFTNGKCLELLFRIYLILAY